MTIENGEIMDVEKQKKSFYWFKDVIPILSVALSVLAFLFATFPQTNPFNTNPIEKANAGHSKSQMFLAHHYYEIGDIEESYYWYKIASTTKGKHQAAALNNLAYLELTYLKSSDTKIDYLDKAIKVLDNSIELGEKTALENKYILLLSNDKRFFNDIDYELELDEIEKQIAEKMEVAEYEKYRGKWELIETVYNAESVPQDTCEYRFEPTGSDYVFSKNNDGFHWIYSYEIYKRNTVTTLPEYKYICF